MQTSVSRKKSPPFLAKGLNLFMAAVVALSDISQNEGCDVQGTIPLALQEKQPHIWRTRKEVSCCINKATRPLVSKIVKLRVN